MSFEEFQEALHREGAPWPGLSLPLEALWHDARGDWNRAHYCAQRAGGPDGAWVHAYLHRKEGDAANADYWYARAGRSRPAAGFEAEWTALTRELLARSVPKAPCG